MKHAELAFEFIENVKNHKTVDDLLGDLRSRIGFFGMNHVMMAVLPTSEPDVRDLVMLNGWPPEWYERFVRERYYLRDAVTRYAARTTRPFMWNDVPKPFAELPQARKIAGEAAEFGMRNGFLIPFPTSRGWQSCVSFGATHVDNVSDTDEAALALLAYVANKTAKSMLGEPEDAGRLSEREREIVRWIAAGKTNWEISEILSVSESTIEKLLRHARDKLDVVNSTQLIAEAIRRHEIY